MRAAAGVGLIGLGLLLASPTPALQAPPSAIIAGQSVADALKSLQGPELQFVFSSQLVPVSLRVERLPDPGDALMIARAILATHHLQLQQISAHTYAVVADTDRSTPATLTAPPTSLAEIVISASYYQVGREPVTRATTLGGDQLGSQPAPGDDALRAIGRLPGIAQTGVAASSYVRGGDSNEVLVLLDGFPIREPFHVPGYQSYFSVFDPALIARADIYTGGFPARYGDRMSAVFDLRSVDMLRAPQLLGLSAYNAIAAASQGDWLAITRVGTPALLLEAMDQDSSQPVYGDAFGRLRLPVDPQRDWSLNGLWSRDKLDLRDSERGQTGQLTSSTCYFWLHGQQSLGENATLQIWLGSSHIESSKRGVLNRDGIGAGQVNDSRYAQIWDARSLARWSLSPSQQLEAGLDWSHSTARYSYASSVSFDPFIASLFSQPAGVIRNLQLRPTRDELSAFVSHRWRLGDRLASELGLRALRVAGLQLAPTTLLDPRLALSWSLGPRTQLRFALGSIHQADEINELQVEDGLQGFGHPQRSTHLIGGIEHRFDNAITARIEAFSKRQSDPRERHENLLDPLAVLPELSPDRVRIAPQRSELRGVELAVERRALPWSWWTAYTYSDAGDEVAGSEVARTWDQRSAVTLGFAWQRGGWNASAAANLHTGWPRTQIVTDSAGNAAVGPRNAARLDGYSSIDLRGAREWLLASGRLTLTLEISNALNAHNVCCQRLLVTPLPGGNPMVATVDTHWLPLVPELGIRWEF